VYTVADSQAKTAAHAVLAAVFQVRERRLQALLWQRGREPYAGFWALPGGALASAETLEESMRRHLADKVDVRELSHIEQLETLSDPGRNPARRELATGYLGLVPADVDPKLPEDTRWHPVDELPELAYDHEAILLSARERLRGKLSYTNLGFALAAPRFTLAELRDLYVAALGHPVTATNLQRVLLRRRLLEDTGERRHYGSGGGRPAAIYRFRSSTLEITDQFAVLRPPPTISS
jgi:ADP-ribose pyrophosphatase YjhB (NUDIX family)